MLDLKYLAVEPRFLRRGKLRHMYVVEAYEEVCRIVLSREFSSLLHEISQ